MLFWLILSLKTCVTSISNNAHKDEVGMGLEDPLLLFIHTTVYPSYCLLVVLSLLLPCFFFLYPALHSKNTEGRSPGQSHWPTCWQRGQDKVHHWERHKDSHSPGRQVGIKFIIFSKFVLGYCPVSWSHVGSWHFYLYYVHCCYRVNSSCHCSCSKSCTWQEITLTRLFILLTIQMGITTNVQEHQNCV